MASQKFGGSTYDPTVDEVRLTKQLKTLHDYMINGAWRTLEEIEAVTGIPSPSASARLRDLRKPHNGSWIVNRRHRGEPGAGLYEYQLLRPNGKPQTDPTSNQGPKAPHAPAMTIPEPTEAQLTAFIAWFKPRYLAIKAQGGEIDSSVPVVCRWLEAGGLREK